MKNLSLLFLFSLFLCIPVFADEADDLWNNYNIDVTGGKEARAVSDEEFEKAIQKVDSKVNKWRNRYRKWSAPRGKDFSQSNETELIENAHGDDVSLPILVLPVDIEVGGGVLPVGHYQVKGEIFEEKPVLSLYQAGELMTRLPAIETKDDFNQDEILFAHWQNEDDNKLRIIYGSLDFNAYTIVKILQ